MHVCIKSNMQHGQVGQLVSERDGSEPGGSSRHSQKLDVPELDPEHAHALGASPPLSTLPASLPAWWQVHSSKPLPSAAHACVPDAPLGQTQAAKSPGAHARPWVRPAQAKLADATSASRAGTPRARTLFARPTDGPLSTSGAPGFE
jgi:hypothetical protein